MRHIVIIISLDSIVIILWRWKFWVLSLCGCQTYPTFLRNSTSQGKLYWIENTENMEVVIRSRMRSSVEFRRQHNCGMSLSPHAWSRPLFLSEMLHNVFAAEDNWPRFLLHGRIGLCHITFLENFASWSLAEWASVLDSPFSCYLDVYWAIWTAQKVVYYCTPHRGNVHLRWQSQLTDCGIKSWWRN